jgi:hypothetical protein
MMGSYPPDGMTFQHTAFHTRLANQSATRNIV